MSPPGNPLGVRLYELNGTSLRISCGGCEATALWSLGDIGAAYGTGHQVRDVLRRLCCSVCGTRPPASVELVEWMDASDGRTELGWTVELVPALWPEQEAVSTEQKFVTVK